MKRDPVSAVRMQPLRAVVSTANKPFKDWFGASMVTTTGEPGGPPLVMYHGSSRSVEVFDRLASTAWRRPSMDTVGSWFTDKPERAEGYAAQVGRVIYPVYLAISRPKVYDTFSDFLREMHEAEGRRLEDQNPPGLGSTEGLRQRLKAQGYDGIAFTPTDVGELMREEQETVDAVHRARMEEDKAPRGERLVYTARRQRLEGTLQRLRAEISVYGGSTEFDGHQVYVAFEPEQIKSAIGNDGQFNRDDPSILHRRAQGAEAARRPAVSKHVRRLAQEDPVQLALARGDLGQALRALASISGEPVHRALAQRLAPLLDGITQVSLCPQLRDAAGVKSFGAATSDGSRIWLSMEDGVVAEETLLHESVHAAVQHMLLVPLERLPEHQRAARLELRALWRAACADETTGAALSPAAHAQLGEFVAEALTHAAVRQALDAKPWRLGTMWRGFKSALLSALGLSTRQSMQAAALRAVDALMSSPSLGAVARPQDNPAWRAWIAGTKVVDARTGDPLVVYHGTKTAFDTFDYRRIGQQGRSEGAGFYFTTDEIVAAGYGTPMPVYVAMRNPLAYDAKGFVQKVLRKLIERAAQLEARAGGHDLADSFLSNFGDVRTEGLHRVIDSAARMLGAEKTAIDQLGGLVGAGVTPQVVNRATYEVTGHDGVVANGYSNAGDLSNTIYVAFFPEQIKSAIGNRGTFDPNDPNILHQRAWHGTPRSNIERFHTDHVGTGEGAQAYGWGLYFASKREIAEHYRDTLAKPQIAIDGKPLKYQTDDLANALRMVLRNTTTGMPFAQAVDMAAADLEGSKMPCKTAAAKELLANRGGVMERPELASMVVSADLLTMTGEEAYRRLVTALGQDARGASMALHALGVKGIEYLDAASRDEGAGTSNYVIFDGNDVRALLAHQQLPQDHVGLENPEPAPSFLACLQDAAEQVEAGFHFEEGGCWGMALALQQATGGDIVVRTDGFNHAYVRLGDELHDWQGRAAYRGSVREISAADLYEEAARNGVDREQVDADASWAQQAIERARSLAQADTEPVRQRMRS